MKEYSLFAPAIRQDLAAQERVRDWIKALRSGRYQQTTGNLRVRALRAGEKDGYCCLGVACDLYDHDKWGVLLHAIDGIVVPYGDYDALLPPEVQSAYRLRTDDGNFELGLPSDSDEYDNLAFSCLVDMNDGASSFEAIADRIEAELELALGPDDSKENDRVR